MEENDIRLLLETSSRLIDEVALDFKRYLWSQIEWRDRLICIKGPKGCGKTTLILQHIKEAFGAGSDKAVYLALDHIWFASHDVLEAVEWLYAHGCTHLFLDEVHHAEHWARLVKTICDAMGFDSLNYQSLDGMLEAIGIDRNKICTYCWNGKE